MEEEELGLSPIALRQDNGKVSVRVTVRLYLRGAKSLLGLASFTVDKETKKHIWLK